MDERSYGSRPRWGEIQVGDELPTFEVGPITRTGIVRYAGAGGDFNRAHHDEPYAQTHGHPSVFAMGLYHAGILTRIVTDNFGLSGLRVFKVRFTAQVWPGETLRFSAQVTEKRTENGERLVDLETHVTATTGEQKVVGAATVVVDE